MSENYVALTAEQSRDGRSSTSSHTPGPWFVGSLDRNDQPEILGDAGDLIAVVTHECVKPPSMLKANADLIAAAPDLLSACEDCMENRGDWLAMMMAAVLKARGEQ